MEAKATFVVSRSSTGRFALRIEDAVSGLRIVELSLTPEQFANAITSLHTTGVDAELFPDGAAHWGRDRYERQDFMLHTRPGYSWEENQESVATHLAEQGWELERETKANPHRWETGSKMGLYRFSAGRWVRAEAS